MNSHKFHKLSIAGFFIGAAFCAASPASGALVSLSSPTEGYAYDKSVVDRVGTSLSSSPYIGLNFIADGKITYDYALNYDLSLRGPSAVYSGESFYFAPQMTFGSGSLTATQDLRFYTGFDFKYGDINVSNFEIPNLAFGSTYLKTEGSGAIDNSGSSASLLGDGLVKIQTQNGSMSAWDTAGDVIQMLGTMPNQVGLAMAVADSWPLSFDLLTSVGMDIYRQDTAVLSNWDLPSLHTTVGSSNISGGVFTYAVDTTLTYDICLSSIYQYGGSGGLTFDGPGFNSQTLANITGDPWDVTGIANCLPDRQVNVHLTYEAPVISYADWVLAHTQIFELPYLPSFHPPYEFPSVGGLTPLSSNQPTIQAVPEPGTVLLVGSSLFWLLVRRRRFGQQ